MFFIHPEHRSLSFWGKAHPKKPVLHLGSHGAAVIELQKLLLRWQLFSDYPESTCQVDRATVLTGHFDETVRMAVESFQAAMFLVPNGIVDPLTWQVLYAGMPIHMPVLRLGSSGAAVKVLQRSLLDTGDALYSTSVDGVFSSATEWAVRHFQRRASLPVDGVFGLTNWCTLSRALAALTQDLLPSIRGIDLSEVWQVLSEQICNPSLERAILKAVGKLDGSARYYYNRVDLNRDSRLEIVVHVVSPCLKGVGGYPILVFQPDDAGYQLVSDLGLGVAPVIVTEQMTGGWSDLVILSRNETGSDYWFARFDGTRYIGGSSGGQSFTVPRGGAIAGTAFIADACNPYSGIPFST
ncbi:peptidoglycan-binding protein [Oscillatoria sp. FACHB-1407]|uniref:peptidoglycan-binding domain-containing protein n=1 Tax=Oscillatoria sp. FACHB-1407 TaxID=2692847 RepID=UPI001685634A|nr:peptidoglycan-binding protein [Oscillatoria sp. FACHB-1407]MBD2460608.1 peptidoglycan-binding protein [Oscillatoria sp. FACHB-1407]